MSGSVLVNRGIRNSITNTNIFALKKLLKKNYYGIVSIDWQKVLNIRIIPVDEEENNKRLGYGAGTERECRTHDRK